jgi:hypothetical protein
MTKLRPPLSFDQAVTRIAGLLGWEACGALVGRSARAVRAWSDPDADAAPSIEQALILDVAYRAAGGEGAPIFEVYAAKLDLDAQAATASRALPDLAATAAKENGEALAALTLASQPGAPLAVRAVAKREVEEGIKALGQALLALNVPTEASAGAGS